MEFILIGIIAFLASILSFFSGFGLGSMLLPVFALFFPLEVAIGATAIVHFSNNLAKIGLIGKKANWPVLKSFGMMAFLFSFLGSFCLFWISDFGSVFSYNAFGREFLVFPHKLIIGFLMFSFVLFELKEFTIDSKILSNLYLGGAMSGFFGGLSGHQGALRSLFLIRLGLNKEQFIATGIWIAILVDIARLSIYGGKGSGLDFQNDLVTALVVGISFAVAGAFVGRKLLKKITLGFVNKIVALGILIISMLLVLGVV